MNLTDQVVSLELARKLKELGVKQISLFAWAEYPHLMKQQEDGTVKCIETMTEIRGTSYWRKDEINVWSAFTSAELGELLPHEINECFFITEKCCSDLWKLKYTDEDGLREKLLCEINYDNEAIARGEMLVYLIENGLMKV